jgi:phosphoesterase RecJ-like protein
MGREDGLLWTHISREMMQQTRADDGAYDDVMSAMQRIEGMRICALFKERDDGNVKLSLRSKLGIDVSAIVKLWGGGGHKQAAGATLHMNLEAAQQEVLRVLRERLAE